MDIAMKVKRTQQRTRNTGTISLQNGSSAFHFARQRTRKKFHKWYFFDSQLIAGELYNLRSQIYLSFELLGQYFLIILVNLCQNVDISKMKFKKNLMWPTNNI